MYNYLWSGKQQLSVLHIDWRREVGLKVGRTEIVDKQATQNMIREVMTLVSFLVKGVCS